MKFYLLLLLLGFSVTPVSALESFNIEVGQEGHHTLRIQRVITAKTATGVRVHGRVTANHPQYLPAGHVDIAILATDGTLIAQTTAPLRPQVLSRRAKRKGGVRFSGEVVADVPRGSTVKLAYHYVGTDTGADIPLGQVVQ